MSPSQLTRTLNWIAMPVALALIVAVAYNIYQRHFLQQQIGRNYQFDDLPTLESAPVSANIDEIINAHVFGRTPTPDTTSVAIEKEPVKVIPRTPLNIKLTGIIDSSSPENGIAMLEVERGRTLVVSVGENIDKTDAILHQVLPGEVLLERNGVIESVKMARKTLSLATLDSTLLDQLPQPYIEQAGESASGSPKSYPQINASAYRPVETANSTTDSAVPGKINRYPSQEAGEEENDSRKRLAVPRRLRKLSTNPGS